ncbi:hypothetical protein GCM10018987_46430 [Streptomyces cremeus]
MGGMRTAAPHVAYVGGVQGVFRPGEQTDQTVDVEKRVDDARGLTSLGGHHVEEAL